MNARRLRLFRITQVLVVLVLVFSATGGASAAQRTLPGDWDGIAVRKASVLVDSDGYKMWYDGVDFFDRTQVGLATSSDGLSWTKYSDNPVLIGGPEEWDSGGEHGPFVMQDDGLYKMWYEGADANGVRQLGYATSADGISWTKYGGNPVLPAEPGYDESAAGHGTVLFEDSLYKLWYHAMGDQGIIIAYATSPDGISWTKVGPALLQEPGLWDEGGLWGPSVVKVDDTYWMWYSAGSPIYPPSIGAATSPDGVVWTRIGDAPVVTIADAVLGDPQVIFDGGIFKMWFNNFGDGQIYYAESGDGVNWSVLGPALGPGVMFPLDGFHDGPEGNVDANNCFATGWVADPDDPDSDVQVQVLADGDLVATAPADLFREDVSACTGGTCGFAVNLWGLVSADVEHQITVQGYDEETAEWWNLEGTPKSLTCVAPSWFTAFPEGEIVEGWDWPLDAVVHLTIDDPNTADSPDYWQDETVVLAPWGSGQLWVWFEFPGAYDMKPGDVVTLTDGVTPRTHAVQNLSVGPIDVDGNIVSGTADAGQEIVLWSWEDPLGNRLYTSADGDGNWAADFDDIGADLQPDQHVRAEVWVTPNDTAVDRQVLPAINGYHDYDSGDVPNWACNVGGWAMDPDFLDEDVYVRILVDGAQVMDAFKAENYRSDLEESWNNEGGGCPGGTCAFEVSLWDHISHYVTHEITVEAQDLQSNEWFALNATPKTLTCRTYDIYAYNPLTGSTQQITGRGAYLRDTDEYDPTWSPDGKKVAHDVVWGDGHGIYVTNVQTGVSTPLRGAQDSGNDAAWSPSGSQIVFDRRWVDDPSLYRVPSAGGTRRLLRHDAVNAAWSPNGKFLAFHQPSDGSIRTVFFASPGGTARFIGYGEEPAWSPDGKWIAYTRDGDIWKARVDLLGAALGGPIQVTSGPFGDGGPTWSRDSQTIIYTSGMTRDADVWSVPAAGGTPTWLTGAPEFGDWGPAQAKNSPRIAYASFSPEGQAEREWGAAFTSEVMTWAPGDHSYQLGAAYSVPEPGGELSDPVGFNVSDDAPWYEGRVLLRYFALRARAGEGCPAIDPYIRPDQNTLFHYIWVTGEMTYQDALAQFESLTVKAHWDDVNSAELMRHEIFSWSSVDFEAYLCSAAMP